jgi:cyclopropane fatty-acyl-phospholipid synthase-like methyltransferase
MLLEGMLNLLGLHHPPAPVAIRPPAEPARLLVPEVALAENDDPVWPSARISVAEALWGEGFLLPGGEAETLRLAKPLGLTDASSLLLLGAGSGGPSHSIVTEFGAWVSGFEANPRLVAMANERSVRSGLGRRAQVELWNPNKPKFPLHYFHHGVAIEPLLGAKPEATLAAVSLAVKSGGQFVLVEVVADQPLDPTDPLVAAWARLEGRPVTAPSELAITKLLARLGFDVRIVEDVTARHTRQTIEGWRDAVAAMQGTRPNLRQMARVIREAERWLARCRLMRAGKLRLVRWHAIGRGGRAIA